jgi:hypothetical protein
MEPKSKKRKNQEKTFKSAILYGTIGIFVVGIFSITESTINTAIIGGIAFGIVIFLSILFWGKMSWDKQVKKLQSKKYEGLNELGIVFNDFLIYEGVYREFLITVAPCVKQELNGGLVEYDIIYAFYQSKSGNTDKSGEAEIIDYYLGQLFFFDTSVCFIPKDFIKTNFKENIDGLINILNREKYKPISREEFLKP